MVLKYQIKSTILSEIDKLLGRSKPPAIEYIFVEPAAMWKIPLITDLFGIALSRNPYGHSALRYTKSNGEQVLMNICGLPGEEMVTFLKPDDYLYSTTGTNEQGGVYNRNMVSVRVEDWPADRIDDLDYYFHKLQRREHRKEALFSLALSPIYYFISSLLPIAIAERGNCALWTSRGLQDAGIVFYPSFWPKSIWIDIFEVLGSQNANNINVVSYRRIPHAKGWYAVDGWVPSGVAALHPIKNLTYFSLDSYANVAVQVPPNSTTAEPILKDAYKPSYYRYHRFGFVAILAMTIVGIRWRKIYKDSRAVK